MPALETTGLGRMDWGWPGGKERTSLPLGWNSRSGHALILPQLKASDADEGEFGRVWYRILRGEWSALGWRGGSSCPGDGRFSGCQGSGRQDQGSPGYCTQGRASEMKRAFSDHFQQIGCLLIEGAAFDCYALRIPQVPW